MESIIFINMSILRHASVIAVHPEQNETGRHVKRPLKKAGNAGFFQPICATIRYLAATTGITLDKAVTENRLCSCLFVGLAYQFFFDARSFTGTVTQVIQFRTTYITAAFNDDRCNLWRIQ